jgi:hypothetical protein
MAGDLMVLIKLVAGARNLAVLAAVERGGLSRKDTPARPQLNGHILNQGIMSGKKIAVPDEIYERVQKVATAEGTTVEELATKALERDLARRRSEVTASDDAAT